MEIALIVITCWSMLIGVFLVGWHRVCQRNEAYDRSFETAKALEKATPRIVSAGTRPYPE